ncbi:PLP-dependent transferase [Neolentinus lepideus HHB14362 ss-1]|uniref:cystathionine gamma-synthase n=1 Tax=Neolentinus lepideus HHB14362 ss-1 TaxID=1314782 RepID=A0A165SA21_9AGAM|nr:PLP-dependent transferase [Neolentinus lepideus HHB14362 ss-1]
MSAAVTTVLGTSVPPFTPHAISVSLPTWKDNVGYEEGEKRVIDAMVIGYPRFFIHLSIRKLASICEQKFGVNGEKCLLCPTKRVAEECRAFMLSRSAEAGTTIPIRLVQFVVCPEDKQANGSSQNGANCVELHIVLFPADRFPLAKQFWQHAGKGISSRLAERALSILPDDIVHESSPPPLHAVRPMKLMNRHYSRSASIPKSPTMSAPPSPVIPSEEPDTIGADESTYLEERYGRNLPVEAAAAAKRAMRRRIAGVLVNDDHHDAHAGSNDVEIGPSSRGVSDVTEHDVFLYPTGMAAIWSAHQLALGTRPSAKSVCFGFPYADTLKVLEKWGPGCHFYGHGLDSDLDSLAELLEKEALTSSSPPVLALFTEFPSNPLLRSPDLVRLRALADKYDFLIVVDETLANFVNVELLPYADIVVSSLSKVFSGDANVMGGSLVLNPKCRHYPELKTYMAANFEDCYFDEDAIYMERNSRNFRKRIYAINENTEALCDFLRARSLADGASAPCAIKDVYYPKWSTPENYERCRIKAATSDHERDGGYGGLFSLTFTTKAASHAFFDALPCNKGPSLGTNFTLASPYVVLAHYAELDWVEQFGVDPGLVRISVGLEDRVTLLSAFNKALKAAEDAVRSSEVKQ